MPTQAMITPEIAPFWDAAAAGQLVVKHCNACGQNHYYPRAHCPFCMSSDVAWLTCTGEGVIYSFTTLKRGPAPAYVTLAEGPTILSAIIDCEPGKLAIGRRVVVVFRPLSEGGPSMPVFTLVRD